MGKENIHSLPWLETGVNFFLLRQAKSKIKNTRSHKRKQRAKLSGVKEKSQAAFYGPVDGR